MKSYSLLFIFCSLILTGCSSDYTADSIETKPRIDRRNKGMGTFLGSDGLSFGGRKKQDEEHGLGVNSHLWRASLDVISFMPLTTADPFGGVILTDWYISPSAPQERFKVNIYILDQQLRSDGIKVSMFRQVLTNGQWADASVNSSVTHDLETSILKRARHYRKNAQR